MSNKQRLKLFDEVIGDLEQLRDIYYGRYTYDDDNKEMIDGTAEEGDALRRRGA
jgi:hypothetical protein